MRDCVNTVVGLVRAAELSLTVNGVAAVAYGGTARRARFYNHCSLPLAKHTDTPPSRLRRTSTMPKDSSNSPQLISAVCIARTRHIASTLPTGMLGGGSQHA